MNDRAPRFFMQVRSHIKALVAAVAFLASIAGVGWAANAHLDKYADKEDTAKSMAETRSIASEAKNGSSELQRAFMQHLVDEAAFHSEMRVGMHNIEADQHFYRDQLWDIARVTKAHKVPAPEHDETK